MFIKPYRSPVSSNSEINRKKLFEKDLWFAPEEFAISLRLHYLEHQSKQLVPILRNATGVSFQYSNSFDYIIRDIGYASFLIKTLLDPKFKKGFNHTVDSIFQKMDTIDKFLMPPDLQNSTISMLLDLNNKTDYDKSIVIGLKPDSQTIYDIEYIDIFYDTKSDAVVCNKILSKRKEIERISRVGVSLRLYLEQDKSDFSIVKETHNCVLSDDDGNSLSMIRDASNVLCSQYVLDSTEYNFVANPNHVDNLAIRYLEKKIKLLSKRLGYTVDVINKDILDLIDMSII